MTHRRAALLLATLLLSSAVALAAGKKAPAKGSPMALLAAAEARLTGPDAWSVEAEGEVTGDGAATGKVRIWASAGPNASVRGYGKLADGHLFKISYEAAEGELAVLGEDGSKQKGPIPPDLRVRLGLTALRLGPVALQARMLAGDRGFQLDPAQLAISDAAWVKGSKDTFTFTLSLAGKVLGHGKVRWDLAHGVPVERDLDLDDGQHKLHVHETGQWDLD